jgi:Conjugative transposon protein TcpC
MSQGADARRGAGPERRARAFVEARPLWRMRLSQRAGRCLVGCAALAVTIGLVRNAVAPATTTAVAREQRQPAGDLAAAGFASLFARVYLSWHADELDARKRSLEPFAGSTLAAEAGTEPPYDAAQRVLWDAVVQEREPRPSLRVFTVAVETEPGGLVYLAVSVLRRPDRKLALASYPAFVGPPASGGADPVELEGAEVLEPALTTVVGRALRNYLAPAPSELAADLVPGAQIATPRSGLTVEGVQRLTWATGAGVIASATEGAHGAAEDAPTRDHTVVALIDASSVDGARFTLAYEVEVRRVSGRWEIVAIETDPDD